MVIFDARPSITVLAVAPLVCERCAVPATQRILKRVMRFSVLRLPLFPVATGFYMTCDSCQSTTRIERADAEAYAAPEASDRGDRGTRERELDAEESARATYTSSTARIS